MIVLVVAKRICSANLLNLGPEEAAELQRGVDDGTKLPRTASGRRKEELQASLFTDGAWGGAGDR
eukprot:COSAG06_NODE_5001_length_3796_cov_29.826393_2_plen_65_part_00